MASKPVFGSVFITPEGKFVATEYQQTTRGNVKMFVLVDTLDAATVYPKGERTARAALANEMPNVTELAAYSVRTVRIGSLSE